MVAGAEDRVAVEDEFAVRHRGAGAADERIGKRERTVPQHVLRDLHGFVFQHAPRETERIARRLHALEQFVDAGKVGPEFRIRGFDDVGIVQRVPLGGPAGLGLQPHARQPLRDAAVAVAHGVVLRPTVEGNADRQLAQVEVAQLRLGRQRVGARLDAPRGPDEFHFVFQQPPEGLVARLRRRSRQDFQRRLQRPELERIERPHDAVEPALRLHQRHDAVRVRLIDVIQRAPLHRRVGVADQREIDGIG
ncbi:MAG: hypothetical protein B9S34_14500, partial [Opitutia bacterium Tous-C1TDCM]